MDPQITATTPAHDAASARAAVPGLGNKRVIIVMPAFNAAKTLAVAHRDIPHGLVDEIILVDDA